MVLPSDSHAASSEKSVRSTKEFSDSGMCFTGASSSNGCAVQFPETVGHCDPWSPSPQEVHLRVNLHRFRAYENPWSDRREQADIEDPLLVPPVVVVKACRRVVGADAGIVA